MKTVSFQQAEPVWAEGRETEMNLSLVFRAVVPKTDAVLRVAGHSDYQVFVNGAFLAQGPARAGHGFFRVDELTLTALLTKQENTVCILCAGYNTNSFYLTDQPSFVCAEIVSGEKVLFATGTQRPFECAEYRCRTRKVQRYSFQRPFTESYAFDGAYDRIFTDPSFSVPGIPLSRTGEKRFIARDTLRSDYEARSAQTLCASGRMAPAEEKRSFCDRSYSCIDEVCLKGFPPEELEVDAVNALYRYRAEIVDASVRPAAPVTIPADGFALYDMGVNTTGYIRLTAAPEKDAVVWVVFNEKLPADGVPDPGRDSCANVVRWALEGGRSYDLLSFEPYTYRFIQVVVTDGSARISGVSQLCEHYPAAGLRDPLTGLEPALQKIYDAAVETFRQNATDIFMDCPSRERAGWLCDSFFTSRAEYALTGESRIERAFLENFIMEESFRSLPDGVLPMCYPSDHPDGTYIPNWAMWYGVELAEYAQRSGDRELVGRAREKMYALAAFLKQYENESGLLEKLESWVFVEWSRANDFVQDVNFPTNMLYAKFLDCVGGLYGDGAMLEKAARLRRTIRQTAFDGDFFIDNAVRENGTLRLTENHTETAQYYAFFSGVATPETDPALYRRMLEAFGPDRDPETEYPDVPVSNAFIGNYLRLDILYKNGEYDRLLREVRSFFLPMAESTGTLWENMHDGASCCHGFASGVAYWLHRICRS